MGVGKSRINQCMIKGSEIVEIPKDNSRFIIVEKNKQNDTTYIPKNIFGVSRSICKINTHNNVYGSGFLIKFSEDDEDNIYYLMTCEHVIKKELINQKATISFSYDNEKKNKEIILDKDKRIIMDFKDLEIDATLIQILKDDNINDGYFLFPEICYMDNLNRLINKKIQIPQFPLAGKLSYSEGNLKNIDNFELIHNCSTESCSSGSPLILQDSINIIGIHKSSDSRRKENYADSIAPIFDFIQDKYCKKKDEELDSEMKSNEIINDEEFKNNFNINQVKIKLEDNFNDQIENITPEKKKNKFIDGETFNLTNPEDNDDYPLEKLLEYFLSERNISFILKINSENGIVELIDKNGCCLFLKIEKFFLKLKENYEVNKCLCAYNSNEHTDENKYCINCNIFICSLCSIQHLYNNHTSIPKNYLGSICLIHCKETSFYCKDCEKSVCKECLDKFHKSHMKSEINRKFVKKAKKEINWKNKQLSKLIEFYRMIRLASEDEPGNHYYIKNIINVGRLIELEERRNKYDKDLAIYRIKQLMNRSV